MSQPIQFRSLDDLLAFLGAARQQPGGAAAGRACQGQVYVGKDAYAVVLPGEVFNERWCLCGGRLMEGSPSGPFRSLNDLLQHLPIEPAPAESFTEVPSLVLALPVGTGGTAQATLHEVWRQIPKQRHAQSRFYLEARPVTGGAWHVVEIEDVDPAFDGVEFRRANRERFEKEGLRILAPAWQRTGCPLYVEWGYRYPKPQEFGEFFELGDVHFWMCLAAGPARMSAGRGPWYLPAWHGVRGDRDHNHHYRIHDVLELVPQGEPRIGELVNAGTITPMELPLGIGQTRDAIAAAHDLDARIALLQREVELLGTRRDRLQQRAHREFLPLYVWWQPAGSPGLPRGLAELVTRPLGELGRFLYAQEVTAEGCRHYVAGQDRLAAGAALAVACDQTYLCESRWLDWGLPLFVRQDCALTIEIDEAALADRVWTVMEEAGVTRPAGEDVEFAVLADPAPSANGALPGGLSALRFTSVSLTVTLDSDQCLRLVNARSDGPTASARLVVQSQHDALTALDVRVSTTVTGLDETLRQRAGAELQRLEQDWEAVRTQLQQATFEARLAEIAGETLAGTYRTLAPTWAEFVNRTLEADRQIAHCKLEALGDWGQKDSGRKENLEKCRKGQLDVEKLIADRRVEYERILPELQAKNAEIERALQELGEQHQRVRAEHNRLAEQQRRLETETARHEGEARELEGKIAALRQGADRNAEWAARLDQLPAELAAAQTRAARDTHRIEAARRELQTAIERAQRLLEQPRPGEPPAPGAPPGSRPRWRWFSWGRHPRS